MSDHSCIRSSGPEKRDEHEVYTSIETQHFARL